MTSDRRTTLVTLARALAAGMDDFQDVKGPGAGDRATHTFMRELRRRAAEMFGIDYSERRTCGDTSFAADFYIP